MSDVVNRHDVGELARALDEHAVVVDVHADVFAADAVVAVRDGVHEALEPGVLGVFGDGFELHRPVDLELELPQLGRYELARFGDRLHEGAVERAVLDDPQARPGSELGAVHPEHPDPHLRQGDARALSEQHHARVGEMSSFERADAAQQLLVAHVRPEGVLVHGERLAVHVLDAVVEQHLAFEVVLALVVLQRSDLLIVEPDALVPLSQGDLSVLAAADDAALLARHVHDEHLVVLSLFVHRRHSDRRDRGGGRELRQVRLLEPLDAVRLVAPEARHRAVVLDAHHELAARRVGERHHVLGDLVHVFAGALAVEVVAFPCPGEVFDVVFLKATVHVPSVPDGRHFTSALLRHPSCAPASATSPYQASEPRSPQLSRNRTAVRSGCAETPPHAPIVRARVNEVSMSNP